MFFFLLVLFLLVAAALWFQGLWSAGVTVINLLLAAMIATNLYEPIAALVDELSGGSFTYLLDFIVIWFLFAFTYGMLRLFTDGFSRTRVKFDMPVEMAGRTIFAVWAAWLFVCFTAFSMHLAPLNSPTPLGAWTSPEAGVFFNADRLWMRFMHSRSRGALSRAASDEAVTYPGDEDVQAFDPLAQFPLKAHDRRAKYAAAEAMRIE